MPSETETLGRVEPQAVAVLDARRAALHQLANLLAEELARQEQDEQEQASFAAKQGWASVPDAVRADWRQRVRLALVGTLPTPKRSLFGWLGRLFSRPAPKAPGLPSAWPRVSSPTKTPAAR